MVESDNTTESDPLLMQLENGGYADMIKHARNQIAHLSKDDLHSLRTANAPP
jgi:hypothetical protein